MMLQNLDAQELNDWRRYEMSEGHLGGGYDSEQLANIVDQLKLLRLEHARSDREFQPTPRNYWVPQEQQNEEQKKATVEAENKANMAALDLALEAQASKRK